MTIVAVQGKTGIEYTIIGEYNVKDDDYTDIDTSDLNEAELELLFKLIKDGFVISDDDKEVALTNVYLAIHGYEADEGEYFPVTFDEDGNLVIKKIIVGDGITVEEDDDTITLEVDAG